MFPQTNRMGDFVKLLVADGFKTFAGGSELLDDLDGLFGHDLVSVFGATHEEEIRAGGHSFVSIRIKTEAEHQGPVRQLSFGRVCH